MNVDTYKRRHEYIETSSQRVLAACVAACVCCVRVLHASAACGLGHGRPFMSAECVREKDPPCQWLVRERETVHVRGVEEAVAAAHFDEGTIVGDALDNAWPHLHHTHKHSAPSHIVVCVCDCVCVCVCARARERERERERKRERERERKRERKRERECVRACVRVKRRVKYERALSYSALKTWVQWPLLRILALHACNIWRSFALEAWR
jgi:hypothetical protein